MNKENETIIWYFQKEIFKVASEHYEDKIFSFALNLELHHLIVVRSQLDVYNSLFFVRELSCRRSGCHCLKSAIHEVSSLLKNFQSFFSVVSHFVIIPNFNIFRVKYSFIRQMFFDQ